MPLKIHCVDSAGLREVLPVELNLEAPDASDPTGPDSYGYIAIENNDHSHPQVDPPEYRWVNCSPWGGDVNGESLPFPASGETDSSVLVELPFDFRYYGQNFRQITVCNNGWIAVGNQVSLKNQQNWILPGIGGAFGMIAPFWDRLEMVTRSDGVFYFYDRENGRFIIQWQTGVRDINNRWYPNAFQVILYDPQQWQTPTGDSPILFQYHTVNNVQNRWEANAYSSVGISSPDGQEGLTLTYWDRYLPSVHRLEGGRAILWYPLRWKMLGTIEGKVRRWIDSAYVPFAEVRVENGPVTFTDDEGSFHLSVHPDSMQRRLVVWHPFYEEWSSDSLNQDSLIVEEGDTLHLDIILYHLWLYVEPETLRFQIQEGGWEEENLTLIALGRGEAEIQFELVYPDSQLTPDDFSLRYSVNNFPIVSGDTVVVGLTPVVGGRLINGGSFRFDLHIITHSAPGTLSIPV
ncbi:MAG: hypothetical protein ACK4OO_07185, partial [bacterium]